MGRAENWWVNRVTIEPQTLRGLKEIELKTRKIRRKNQQCVTIMQSRLANKNDYLPCLPEKLFGVMLRKLLYRWSNQLRKALQWCRRTRLKATELQHEIQLGVAGAISRYSNRAVTLKRIQEIS